MFSWKVRQFCIWDNQQSQKCRKGLSGSSLTLTPSDVELDCLTYVCLEAKYMSTPFEEISYVDGLVSLD